MRQEITTVLDVDQPAWNQLTQPQRIELSDWIDAVTDDAGLVRSVELISEGAIRVTFLANADGEPAKDSREIAILRLASPFGAVVDVEVATVTLEYAIDEPPPVAWPMNGD
jgi:hypothetical protein